MLKVHGNLVLEFDRALIIPHGPIKKYLKSGDVNDVKGSVTSTPFSAKNRDAMAHRYS